MSYQNGNGKFKAAERRKRVAAAYLKGATQCQMAEDFAVNQSTISRDLNNIHDKWIESTLVDFDAAKVRELQKTDQLERTYWDAWTRSMEEQTKTRVQSRDGETMSWVERVNFFGDPRFLKGIEFCITNRCRILGIYAAAEKEQGVAAGPVILRVQYGENGLDELDD